MKLLVAIFNQVSLQLCVRNPHAPEMERLFGILGSGNLAQRQNALCVLSELLRILSSSDDDTAIAVRCLP